MYQDHYPSERVAVGILGGTGLVGRMLARVLVTHPVFCCGPIVGSSRSVGQLFENVWQSKEDALTEHYGDQLWTPDQDFPQELKGVTVSSLDQLISSDCRVVISAIAPSLGKLEDVLAEKGCTVVSISPYKRQEGVLCVLEANHDLMLTQIMSELTRELHQSQLLSSSVDSLSSNTSSSSVSEDDSDESDSVSDTSVELAKPRVEKLIKSPNCVCCGTSTVLSGLANAFGTLDEVSVTTFQSLSGRGDAMYPGELVIGNVYPLGGTSEPTEALIQEELQAVMGNNLNTVSVSAYRVSVQRGHMVDVRVKLADKKMAQELRQGGIEAVENIYQRLEQFDPLRHLRESGICPSIPTQSIICERRGGCPRPKTHHLGLKSGGFSVTVGNVKVGSGPFDICLTLVVDNLVKGALGAALQLLEFRNYLSPLGVTNDKTSQDSAEVLPLFI